MTTPSETAAETIQVRAGNEPIEIGIVLGTGLGAIGDLVEDAVAIPYADLPGFPETAVSGHAGKLLVGRIEGTRVAMMLGRAHYYESGDPAIMHWPLETLALLGAQILLLTNSAGSVNLDLFPGSLAVVTDHINFAGANPLIGAGNDSRFVSLADAYDRRLRMRIRRAAIGAGIQAPKDGVYMWFSGPSFETAAEIRMAKMLGADLVGMSTVPEVILARRLGLRVAAISVVTNYATGIGGGNPTHTETKQVAASGSVGLKRLVRHFCKVREDV